MERKKEHNHRMILYLFELNTQSNSYRCNASILFDFHTTNNEIYQPKKIVIIFGWNMRLKDD